MPWRQGCRVKAETAAVSTERLLSFLGLCRRAGGLVFGTPLVCEALAARRRPYLVVYAEGASEATRKKICNKCSFYRVPVFSVAVSTDVLAHALGKTGDLAAVAVKDENFARELLKMYAQGKAAAQAEEG